MALMAGLDPFFDALGHSVPESGSGNGVQRLFRTEVSRGVVMILDGARARKFAGVVPEGTHSLMPEPQGLCTKGDCRR